MKYNTLVKLDKYVGVPLCLIITLINKIAKIIITKKSKKDDYYKKILFIKLTEQGATILLYPTIKKAVELFSQENIFFCVFKENVEIIELLSIIPDRNLIIIDHSNLLKFIKSIINYIRRCWKEKIDITINLEFFSRGAAILSYLSKAKFVIGHHPYNNSYPYIGNFYDYKIFFNYYNHISLNYYLTLIPILQNIIKENKKHDIIPKEEINNIHLTFPKIFITKEERDSFIDKLKKTKKTTIVKPIILINPNASDIIPIRKWPKTNFLELTKLFLKNFREITIIFTGSKSEASEINETLKLIKNDRIISLAGETTLRDLIILYSISDLLITNDSGPAHFATLTDISTIVLFGPETPEVFSPKSHNTHVIWKKLSCSPCVNFFNYRISTCSDNICMKKITPKEVFELSKKLLSKQNYDF